MENYNKEVNEILTIILYFDNKKIKKYTIKDGFENINAYNLNCFHASDMIDDFKEFIILTESKYNYDETVDDILDYYQRLTFPITVNTTYKKIDLKSFKKHEYTENSYQLRIYSKSDWQFILTFEVDKFISLVKSDIASLLNIIDKFKPINMIFEFPTDSLSLIHIAKFNFNDYNDDDFYDELEQLYKNIILIFSTIYSQNLSCPKFRNSILKILEFLKHYTGILTFEMETRGYRIYYYMEEYFKIKLQKNVNKNNNNIIFNTVILYEKEIKKLEPEVSQYIVNLNL
ncbi:Hypothetical protein SRAE_X000023000 [Strongyloides ratti]|uniref:Uncharacterized protein n=1 Tax=Strongyloides ratti TaxID=34506 RepID=A0A090LM28_STRRB|nr:Hypothetical protein SRAE_X000023000 [Strongyloides ratti]CEF70900.1 Hypothetical protein SRAE_X000023000 [Strongyloides ratti]